MATTFRTGLPSELESLDPARFLTWVIERAGHGVGYLVLTLSGPPEQATAAYISGLYVEPEARGQGIGAKALQFAGDVGRTFGLRVYAKGVAGEDKRLAA
jgi:GNAT superfamily N-acetyltransferase